MRKSQNDLRSIVSLGSGIIIDASIVSTTDLTNLAQLASEIQTTVVFKNVIKKSTVDLKKIAKAGGKYVVFDLA